MRVVIDTNVIVSGLLSPYGAPGQIVRMLVSGELEICYDARIITEYREVLNRPKFSFERAYLGPFTEYIECFGIPISAKPLLKRLRDPYDEPFLEVAISGDAESLITGNIAHYPLKGRHPFRILTPRQFFNRHYQIMLA